jgi:hypothetical protein
MVEAAASWPYWIKCGFAVALFLFVLFVSYGARDDVRKWKFLLGTWIFGVSAAVCGGIAFGLTEWTRSDGVEVMWGPAALAVATHGPVVACVILSVSYEFIDAAIGFLLGTSSAVFILFATLTPVQNGGNPENAAIVFTVLSGLCGCGAAFLVFVAALNWTRFMFFPLDYRLEEGRANVNWRFNVVLAIGVGVGLLSYMLFYTLSPAGWRQYSEVTQTWLSIFVSDLLFVFILTGASIYYFNPDGESATSTQFEILAPAAAVQPSANQIGIPIGGGGGGFTPTKAETVRFRQATAAKLF